MTCIAEIPLIGKGTSQSSTAHRGTAERAVDRNVDGNYNSDSCTHTGNCNA